MQALITSRTSAMAPGAILDIEPGDIVLDLCAALRC